MLRGYPTFMKTHNANARVISLRTGRMSAMSRGERRQKGAVIFDQQGVILTWDDGIQALTG